METRLRGGIDRGTGGFGWTAKRCNPKAVVTPTLLLAVLMMPLFGQDSGRGVPASVQGDWMSDGVSTVDEDGLSGGTGCRHVEFSLVWMKRRVAGTRYEEWMSNVRMFEKHIGFSLVPVAGRPYEFEGTLSPDGQYLILGGHFKTDHRGSLQNRPMEHHPGRACFTLPAGPLASPV